MGDDVEHIVSFARYKMLTKALYYATEIFFKTIHNKAETVLMDFVISKTCLKFDHELPKSKVAADGKSCKKVE